MDGILLQKIFDSDYAHELIDVIHSNGNVDDFLQKLEARQREEFIKTDENICLNNQSIDYNQKKVLDYDKKIAQLEKEKSLALEINKRINEIRATYPKSKQKELENYLRDALTTEEKKCKELLTSKPKGLINRIRYGKSLEAGNAKLEELMAFYKENNVYEISLESSVVKDAVTGKSIEEKIAKIDKDILDNQKDRNIFAENVETSQKQIQRRINLYDETDAEKFEFANKRKKQRQNIKQFSEDFQTALKHPETISKDEILRTGLSEEYIERQIMESKFPEKNLRSIRRSYEMLDRPVAPMIAFDRGEMKADGSLYAKDIADDIIEKLKQKGLDVVTETDPRAIDTNVFVVDKKSKAIYAPFLSPDDALKANIAMIDAIYECEGKAARSSLRTRETFAIATHKNLTGENFSSRNTALDLEIVASHYSKENYDRVMGNFAQEFADKGNYQTLTELMPKILADDPERYDMLVAELQAKAQPFISSNTWTFEKADQLAKEFLTSHKEDIVPYVKKTYQDAMLQEAFEHGIDPHLPNKENLLMMENNKPITSVFHAGQNGGLPYSVLGIDKRMTHVYGASTLEVEMLPESVRIITGSTHTGGSLGYAFGQSSHDQKAYRTNKKFGFVYEYESRGDKQEIVFLEKHGGIEVEPFKDGKYDLSELNSIHDETAILPHQNKLKKIYIAVENNEKGFVSTRIFPLELDEAGQIKDKRWRDFVELHNPVDDTLEGLMVERQNNMIAEYDKLGKEKMMDRHVSIKNSEKASKTAVNIEAKITNITEAENSIATKSVTEGKAQRVMAENAAEVVGKTAIHTASTASKSAASGIVGTIAKTDNAVNKAIDTVVEKGAEKLNNTTIGKIYTEVEKSVTNSAVGKVIDRGVQKTGATVVKTAQKIGQTAAKTAAGQAVKKAVVKTVGKTAAKAVGKSILKKIPIISVGAGLVFGAQRAMSGDWKGAVGEVASGTLGTFPGLGTAASVAIDVGLAGRDIYNDVQQSKQANTATRQTGAYQFRQQTMQNTSVSNAKPQQKASDVSSNENFFRNLRMGINNRMDLTEAESGRTDIQSTINMKNKSQQMPQSVLQMKITKGKEKII